MKQNNYFLPSLITGFGVGVLSFVPGIKNLGCCFLLPVAAFFAVYLYRKSTNTDFIEFKSAFVIGLLTGLIAAVFSTAFEIILTLITRTNDFVESLPQAEVALQNWELGGIFDNTFELMRRMGREIRETGFSFLYTVFLFISNIVINPIFAFLGAIVARAYFNRKALGE
jgi:Na+-driven multidrug efflux pump